MSLGPSDGSGVRWCVDFVFWRAWWTTGCLEVPKPRLHAHFDRDARAEGWDLLPNIDHEPYQAPSANGHEGPIWDPHDVHGHGSARSKRVRSNIFWGESKSGRPHLLGLGPDDGNDTGSANWAESLSSGKVANRGGGFTAELSQAKEDVDAHSNWASCGGLRYEARYSFTSDGVFLVV